MIPRPTNHPELGLRNTYRVIRGGRHYQMGYNYETQSLELRQAESHPCWGKSWKLVQTIRVY